MLPLLISITTQTVSKIFYKQYVKLTRIEYVYLIAVIGPRAKGEITLLAVEGEVGHVHHT